MVRTPEVESPLALRWVVRRFIDPEARFLSAGEQPLEGDAGEMSSPLNPGHDSKIVPITSFAGLLSQYALTTDPALWLLSEMFSSQQLGVSLASSMTAPRTPDAGPQITASDDQQAFALLDKLYERLRRQVQKELDGK